MDVKHGQWTSMTVRGVLGLSYLLNYFVSRWKSRSYKLIVSFLGFDHTLGEYTVEWEDANAKKKSQQHRHMYCSPKKARIKPEYLRLWGLIQPSEQSTSAGFLSDATNFFSASNSRSHAASSATKKNKKKSRKSKGKKGKRGT